MQFVELAPSWICSLTGDYTDAFPCITNANHVDKDDKTFNVCTLPEEQRHYKRDTSNKLSLHNWIEDLDLACTNSGPLGPIALLGSLQFVGWAISAFITPRLSDIYGRKKIFLASMLIQFVSLIGIFISRTW
jgi:hypothetical protein